MNKTKIMIACALCGFILSFITGLVSSVQFGMVLLRALFSALLCVGLYAAGSYAYSKFLSLGGPSDKRSDASVVDFGQPPKMGQMVDIKLDDESLPEEENGPSFKIPKELMPDTNVMNSVAAAESELMQNSSSASSSSASSEAEEEPFLTITSAKNAANSSAQTYNENAVKNEPFFSASAKAGGNADSEIGSLPDMDTMLSDMQKSPTGEIITNSDFAKAGKAVESSELKSADTEVMARAIHTVLTRDQD